MTIENVETDWFLIISNAFDFCPNSRCKIHQDRSKFAEASAIVFSAQEFNSTNLPPERFNRQFYVFLLHESPVNTHLNFSEINSFFNLTMTYRTDSDLYAPYGFTKKSENSNWFQFQKLKYFVYKTKNRSVAWMVGQCGTQTSNRGVNEKTLKIFPRLPPT